MMALLAGVQARGKDIFFYANGLYKIKFAQWTNG